MVQRAIAHGVRHAQVGGVAPAFNLANSAVMFKMRCKDEEAWYGYADNVVAMRLSCLYLMSIAPVSEQTPGAVAITGWFRPPGATSS